MKMVYSRQNGKTAGTVATFAGFELKKTMHYFIHKTVRGGGEGLIQINHDINHNIIHVLTII